MDEFRFENKTCPVCRKKLHEGDDIAVCPVCGTPHHRSCYLEKNECGVNGFHAQGFVWEGRLPDEPVEIPVTKEVSPTEENIETPQGQIPDDVFEMLPDIVKMMNDERTGKDGVSMKELLVYTNTSVWHYGTAFKAFRQEGKKHRLGFNVCSGLFAPIFQFYRKMDAVGIILLIITLAPAAFFLAAGENQANGIYMAVNILSLLQTIIMCIFGDYLFYRHAVRRILKMRENFSDNVGTPEYYEALSEDGRPSFGRAALGFLASMLVEACVIVAAANSTVI